MPFDAFVVNRQAVALLTGGEEIQDRKRAEEYGRIRMRQFSPRADSPPRLLMSLDNLGTYLFRTEIQDQGRAIEQIWYSNPELTKNSISYLGFADILTTLYGVLSSVCARNEDAAQYYDEKTIVRDSVLGARAQLGEHLTQTPSMQAIHESLRQELQPEEKELQLHPRRVTYVIGDIVESSKLALDLSSGSYQASMSAIHAVLNEAWSRNDGIGKIEGGDSFVARFTTEGHSSGAEKALKFACEVQEITWRMVVENIDRTLGRTSTREIRRLRTLTEPIRFRIGVNSGTVHSDDSDRLDLPNEHLNVAGHLQKAADPGNLLLALSTFTDLGSDLDADRIVKILAPFRRQLDVGVRIVHGSESDVCFWKKTSRTRKKPAAKRRAPR